MRVKKTRDDHMRAALARVISNDGVASWPSSYGITPVAVVNQWRRATQCGYLRALTDEEVEAYLENRRGVRAVLLAQLELAALDERRPDSIWEGDAPTVDIVAEKLTKVCAEIRWLLQETHTGYTLTPAGVEFLSKGDETR